MGPPPEVVEAWESYWKDWVCDENGQLNKERVMRELYDYGVVIGEVGKVYMEITGGRLSKPNYEASVVIGVANDYQNEVWEQVLADEKEAWEQERMKIKIKKLHPDAILPKRQTAGASGYDMYARVDKVQRIYPGSRQVIGCGFAIELPSGYEAQVRPRSGLAAKHGISIVNTPGSIDSDYRGEVGAMLINHGVQPFDVGNGDRIAQLVIQRVPETELVEADELNETDRGAGGFGSTGV